MTEQQLILVTEHGNGVYQCTLNRPHVFNALSDALVAELSAIIKNLEEKDARAFVLTGNTRAFAAGGDIAEMQGLTFSQAKESQYVEKSWSGLEQRRTPLIAAVNGMAFGGGCELVLLSDIAIAGRSATFAQPETSIGIIPGAGGTQRLIRAVGKSKAMDMILAGYHMPAFEAAFSGLVSRVVDDEDVVDEALRVAHSIASRSKPVITAAREAICAAENTCLIEGLKLEKQHFYGTFALKDQAEGMQAFLDKRVPQWTDS